MTNYKAFYWQSPEGLNIWPYRYLDKWIFEDGLDQNPPRAARAYALVAAVLFDAFIASQDGKFTYWYIRPHQLDPAIVPLFPVPNFPSYPSNHSTFSAARSEILAYLFPTRADFIRAVGKEAGDSRIWAGIHYPMDNDAGVDARQVGGPGLHRLGGERRLAVGGFSRRRAAQGRPPGVPRARIAEPGRSPPVIACALAVLLAAPQAPPAEARVVEYLKAHVKPGQPVVVSELYNKVFTGPEERAALNRLFNTFFKMPLYMAQHQKAAGKPPDARARSPSSSASRCPGEADVMLRIMESDPRMPKLHHARPGRTARSRAWTSSAILAHPRFGKALERTIAGWEGQPAPAFARRPTTASR